MNASASIVVRIESRVAYVSIARPTVKNALGPDEWAGLSQAFSQIDADENVRAVVLRGEGGTFSSGGDLRTMPERLALPGPERRAQLLAWGDVILRMRALRQPIVAVVEGACVGAGLSLALACDLRILSSEAKLGASFHKVGLSADLGLSWLLPRIVGEERALALLYSARIVDATEAVRLGLASEVVSRENLDSRLAEVLQPILAGPPLALAATKQAVLRALNVDLADQLAFEADAQARLSKTADASEGVQAFLQKRAPQFRGR